MAIRLKNLEGHGPISVSTRTGRDGREDLPPMDPRNEMEIKFEKMEELSVAKYKCLSRRIYKSLFVERMTHVWHCGHSRR